MSSEPRKRYTRFCTGVCPLTFAIDVSVLKFPVLNSLRFQSRCRLAVQIGCIDYSILHLLSLSPSICFLGDMSEGLLEDTGSEPLMRILKKCQFSLVKNP